MHSEYNAELKILLNVPTEPQEWMDGVKLKLNPEKKMNYHHRSKSHQRVACTKVPCPTPPKQYLSVGGSKEAGCYLRLRQLL